jgi:hypothetical protein
MASSSSTTELLDMALTGQENFIPVAEEQRPHRFLSLAPVIGASYPARPAFEAPIVASAPVQTTTKTTSNTPAEITPANETGILAALIEGEHEPKTRRSSSVTSDGSAKDGTQRRRFLRLGPVHYGVGLGDWSEDVLE